LRAHNPFKQKPLTRFAFRKLICFGNRIQALKHFNQKGIEIQRKFVQAYAAYNNINMGINKQDPGGSLSCKFTRKQKTQNSPCHVRTEI
jgi:hypothetical protein